MLRVRVRAVRRVLPVRVRRPVPMDVVPAGRQCGHAAVVPAGRRPTPVLDGRGPSGLAHSRRPGRVPHGGQRGRGSRPARMDTALRLPGLRVPAAHSGPVHSPQRYHVRHLRAHHGRAGPSPRVPRPTGDIIIYTFNIILCFILIRNRVFTFNTLIMRLMYPTVFVQ